MATTQKYRYIQISASEIPDRVRFDTPRRNQGQIVTVSYGGVGRGEHGPGDLYKRVTDASNRTTTYYRRSDV